MLMEPIYSASMQQDTVSGLYGMPISRIWEAFFLGRPMDRHNH